MLQYNQIYFIFNPYALISPFSKIGTLHVSKIVKFICILLKKKKIYTIQIPISKKSMFLRETEVEHIRVKLQKFTQGCMMKELECLK